MIENAAAAGQTATRGLVRRGALPHHQFSFWKSAPTSWLIAIFEGRIVSVTKGAVRDVPSSSLLRCAPPKRSGISSGAGGPPAGFERSDGADQAARALQGRRQSADSSCPHLRYFKESPWQAARRSRRMSATFEPITGPLHASRFVRSARTGSMSRKAGEGDAAVVPAHRGAAMAGNIVA